MHSCLTCALFQLTALLAVVHVTHLCDFCSAEGVLQAEKDFNLASHPEIEGIPNLQVCLLHFTHETHLQYSTLLPYVTFDSVIQDLLRGEYRLSI